MNRIALCISSLLFVGLGYAFQTQFSFGFLPAQDRPEAGWTQYKTLIGDVNGDGRQDLIWNVTANENRTYVGLARRDGSGRFDFLSAQDRAEIGWRQYDTLVGDVNGDGRDDLIWNVTADHNRTYVGLARTDGSGRFDFLSPQDRPERGWHDYKTLVGDVNGDGRDDLIWNLTGEFNRTYVGLARRDGSGRFDFLSPQDRPERGWQQYLALVGDVNGDGRDDLIWNVTAEVNRTYVGLARTDGSGRFNFLPAQDRSESVWHRYKTLIGDVNGDGRDDLIWNLTDLDNRTYVGLARQDGSGRFDFLSAQDRPESVWQQYKTLVGDVNGDGRDDLIWNVTAAVNRTYVGLARLDGSGRFDFRPAQDRTESGWLQYKTLVGDVNGDGRDDAIWNVTAQTNRTYIGLGRP